MRSMGRFVVLLAIGTMVGGMAHAQSASEERSEPKGIPGSYETLYLSHVTEQSDALQIVTVLRNFAPRAKISYITRDNAISVYATTEDMQTAKKIVADLDKPDRTYRVTYTIRGMNGSQANGETRQVTMLITAGQRNRLRQGNRVPVVTAEIWKDSSNAAPQVTYIDVGLIIDAGVHGAGDSLRLSTHLEESGVADERSGVGAQDPVIRQTMLTSDVQLQQGKPVVLGVLDVPGTGRQEQIEARAEAVQ
ncbi:MAG TPA: hypothetical protein VJS11_15040 [Acidobacteriaceae bacterium]|nr:hypothetical protein [Acidobacteriaceae bacterium]